MDTYDDIFDHEEEGGIPDDISITYREETFTTGTSWYDERMDEFVQEIENTINDLDEVYWIDRETTSQGNRSIHREVWIYHRDEDDA